MAICTFYESVLKRKYAFPEPRQCVALSFLLFSGDHNCSVLFCVYAVNKVWVNTAKYLL